MARLRSTSTKPRKKVPKAVAKKKSAKASAKYRRNIRKDPEKYEEFKAKDRERKKKAKQEGKIKSKELCERSKRQQQKYMREYMRTYRKKKKAEEECDDLDGIASLPLELSEASIDNLPDMNRNFEELSFSIPLTSKDSRQKVAAKQQVRRDRCKVYKRCKELQERNDKLQRELWALKQKETRKRSKVFSPGLSPKKKMNRLLLPKVRKELFKGIVVQEEHRKVKEKMRESHKTKTVWSRLMAGKAIKKYKLLKQCQDILPHKESCRRGTKWNSFRKGDALQVKFKTSATDLKKREAVIKFFESDTASYPTPGKKDFVKVNGVKVQKRNLNDKMSSLYRKFLSSTPVLVKFSFFCANRPKHVVEPKLNERSTCLCQKCENFKLMFKCLCSNKIVECTTKDEAVKTVCCDSNDEKCLLRNCETCKGKTLKYNVKEKKTVKYSKWITKTVANRVKGKKAMKITTKMELECTVRDAEKIFQGMFPTYLSHIGRVVHQRNQCQWDRMKANCTDEDLCILMDWSESWECKYHEEVQSMHFGGSHKKLSLHTGRVYGKDIGESFCTVSEDTSHGPQGIFAHLKPILTKYVTPKIKNLHIMSDGPTTQYRSGKMFQVVSKWITELLPHVEKIIWNFSEAGHGKGDANGTGGTVKRTAEDTIKYGEDIMDVPTFVSKVSPRCPKIFILEIPDSDMKAAMDRPLPEVVPFKGTMQIHQYVWLRDSPGQIQFKTLSCYECPSPCNHFNMGKPWVMVLREKKNDDLPEKVTAKTTCNTKSKNASTGGKSKKSGDTKAKKQIVPKINISCAHTLKTTTPSAARRSARLRQ